MADSLRVVVDAMRLQSAKKDEKPEEVCSMDCPEKMGQSYYFDFQGWFLDVSV